MKQDVYPISMVRPRRGDDGMEVVGLVLCALLVSGAPNATHRRADPQEPLPEEDDEFVLDYYDEARINISGKW
ncbi:unnamed protein product [Colias eurytheme]|nr:unnamed protein product [Colias eurytheme]